MIDRVRVGVIGAGYMGQHHARVLASLPDSKLVGVADVDIVRARSVADYYNVAAYVDYHELLRHVDAVIVATPTESHYDIGLDCLNLGRHLLVEKPLAISLGEANELVYLAQMVGVILQVGHIEQFNPAFEEFSRALAGQHILALDARRLSPHVARVANTSVVYDLMIHDIDLVLSLINGPVDIVQALGCQVQSTELDHVQALLSVADGPMVNMSASKITQTRVRQLTATCAESFVVADLLARSVMIYRQAESSYLDRSGEVLHRQSGMIEQVHVPSIEPLRAELHHFLTCVRSGIPPRVCGEDAIRALALARDIETRIREQTGELLGELV